MMTASQDFDPGRLGQGVPSVLNQRMPCLQGAVVEVQKWPILESAAKRAADMAADTRKAILEHRGGWVMVWDGPGIARQCSGEQPQNIPILVSRGPDASQNSSAGRPG